MAIEVERPRRFTADEYERMVSLGIFREDERLELIDGEIVQVAPVGHRHGSVRRPAQQAPRGRGRRPSPGLGTGPRRLGVDSVPEPDLALLRPHSYRSASP